MAIRGTSISDTVDYVSDRDPCKEIKMVPVDPEKPEGLKKREVTIVGSPTIFKLKPLDVYLNGWIYDNATAWNQRGSDVGIQTRANETNIQAVKFGLAGIENLHSDDGGGAMTLRHIKANFNGRTYDAVPDAILNALGLQLIAELAAEIKKISEVSGVEAKNSVGASSQSG